MTIDSVDLIVSRLFIFKRIFLLIAYTLFQMLPSVLKVDPHLSFGRKLTNLGISCNADADCASVGLNCINNTCNYAPTGQPTGHPTLHIAIKSTVLFIPAYIAAIVILGALVFMCFVYCNCIRKTNSKDKIYSMMEEAKLDNDAVIVEGKESDDESEEDA